MRKDIKRPPSVIFISTRIVQQYVVQRGCKVEERFRPEVESVRASRLKIEVNMISKLRLIGVMVCSMNLTSPPGQEPTLPSHGVEQRRFTTTVLSSEESYGRRNIDPSGFIDYPDVKREHVTDGEFLTLYED
jgi:hypothetical protein